MNIKRLLSAVKLRVNRMWLRMTPPCSKDMRVVCLCCGGHYRRFIAAGLVPRPNAACPRCGALERHRLLWMYFQEKTNLFKDRLKVLHFAPESAFSDRFSKQNNLDYTTADLCMPRAMVKVDITNIPFADQNFDVILCNHVLEHIPDDHKAMTELYRVLKPGGWAVLQVPLDANREQTYEDFTIISLSGRERAFGQNDHVRVNGTFVRIFETLVQMKYDIGEIDMEFAAIDGTLARVHKAAAGAPSKKKANRKTMPSDGHGEAPRRKSSPPPIATSTVFP